MLSVFGRQIDPCERMARRPILQAAGLGLLGLSLPKVLAAESAVPAKRPRAKSVIFLFLFGGPSQLETFDLKPDAPSKIRGPFKPISSRTPGLLICEHLPKLAAASDKFCVIRSMTHDYNDHSGAGHYMQTGRRWHIPIGGGFSATNKDWPSMGSAVEFLSQQDAERIAADVPRYAVVPNRLGRLEQAGQYVRPGEYAGWLGHSYNGMTTSVDKRDAQDNPYWRNCTDEELTFKIPSLELPADVTVDRLAERASLLEQFDRARRRAEMDPTLAAMDRFRQRALALATSEKTRTALDVRRESANVRDQYGRHLFGQATLVARRLVEAGVRFVTVHYECCDGYSWDSHLHSRDVQNHLLPTFDQACAALITDLDQRGLLAETLVVAVGEMGRTPKANNDWGRGHWSMLFPALVAGAGVRGGTTYGASDKDAELPIDNPVTPEDLAATIYDSLGIDSEVRVSAADGRPMPLVEGGKPVAAVIG
jgi:hypothetical protein